MRVGLGGGEQGLEMRRDEDLKAGGRAEVKVRVAMKVKVRVKRRGGGDESKYRVRVRVRVRLSVRVSTPAALAHVVRRAEDDRDPLVHVLRHQVHDARLAGGRKAARLRDEGFG